MAGRVGLAAWDSPGAAGYDWVGACSGLAEATWVWPGLGFLGSRGPAGVGSGWAGLAAWGSLGLAGARWLRLQGPGSQGVDDPRRLALAGAGLG